MLKRLNEAEKSSKAALETISELKKKLESAQQENYTLRTALSNSSERKMETENLQARLAMEDFGREKQQLEAKLKQMKSKMLKMDMTNFQLKKENIELKDQIISITKFMVLPDGEEALIKRKRSASKESSTREKTHLRIVRSKPNLHGGNPRIDTFASNADISYKLTNTKHSSRQSKTRLPFQELNASANLKKSILQIANRSKDSAVLKSTEKENQITPASRNASVSRLGIKLNHLEEELRAERSLNNKIKQKIASMLIQNTSNISVDTGSRLGLEQSNRGSEQRSTTTTVESKRGHVFKAFNRFSQKMEQLNQLPN